jgi:dephospho-CoA kinase
LDPRASGDRTVIAAVGLAGSGKSTAVEILAEETHSPVVYFGGIVIEEVAKRGLARTQESERAVREDLRSKMGIDAIAQLASPQIESLLTRHRCVIVDGLYSWLEHETMEANLNSNLVTIAVHAQRRVREARIGNRRVRPLTASELHQRDISEIRSLDKATPIVLADYHIVNDGALVELKSKVSAILTEIL